MKEINNTNPLMAIDIYKAGHMRFYKPGTTSIYSGMVPRSNKKYDRAVFVGLQPKLKVLAQPITFEHGQEFFEYWEEILDTKPPQDVVEKINAIVELGYFPICIKAVAEGTIIDTGNVVVTVKETIPGFHWCVGLLESFLLKVWSPTSVATLSNKYFELASKYTEETSDSGFLLPFLVHDFGYRGASSEQTAEEAGAANLMVGWYGTDTVPAVKFLKNTR